MKKEKSNRTFDLISPIYGLFFERQKQRYKQIIASAQDEFSLMGYKRVLDIGCGTGALCSALFDAGLQVTGIDQSNEMLKVAQKKNVGKPIVFAYGDVLQGLDFADNEFEVSIASYVAHGLQRSDRLVMYQEMSRVSSEWIILHDYNEYRSWKTSLIEWLERGDYFSFIRVIESELKELFEEVKIIQVDQRASWYLMRNLKKTAS